jgi:putative membrane protein
MADTRNELAEDRTDLAEDRTLLANERTFAGWMRTGLSSVAIALGFQALFSRMEPGWVPRAISTTFVLVGVLMFVFAERRSTRVDKRLDAHRVRSFGRLRLRLITAALSLASFALVAAIWLLRIERG